MFEEPLTNCDHEWITVLTVAFELFIGIGDEFTTPHRQCKHCDIVFYQLHDSTGAIWEWDNPESDDFCYRYAKYMLNK